MEIQMELAENIREIIDINMCKEEMITFVFPATNIRFIPETFDCINHIKRDLLMVNFPLLRNVPLSIIRYYWTIIKFFNICICRFNKRQR